MTQFRELVKLCMCELGGNILKLKENGEGFCAIPPVSKAIETVTFTLPRPCWQIMPAHVFYNLILVSHFVLGFKSWTKEL